MVEITSGLRFPEGPVAMPDGSVLLVEIEAGHLTRVDRQGLKTVVSHTGGGPNGAAIGPDGHCYICNNGGFDWHPDTGHGLHVLCRARDAKGRIEKVDLKTGRCEVLYDRTDKSMLASPNDIVFDADDGFWFTDLGAIGEFEQGRGRVCYARADGSLIREVVFPMLTPNGIGLSPDGKTLYVAESAPARLWAFSIIGPGELQLNPWHTQTPGRFLWSARTYCRFDSLAVEASGNICVATLVTGGITVISPAGEQVDYLPVPDPMTTNICFGDQNLKTAFMTLSRTGRLMATPWARPGLQLNHAMAQAR